MLYCVTTLALIVLVAFVFVILVVSEIINFSIRFIQSKSISKFTDTISSTLYDKIFGVNSEIGKEHIILVLPFIMTNFLLLILLCSLWPAFALVLLWFAIVLPIKYFYRKRMK